MGGAPQEPFHWKSAGGRPDVSPSKKRTRFLSGTLALALCLKIACFLKLGAAPEELSAFNIWPSLNIEPTLSQISEETLESLKLHERNSRVSNSTEQPTSNEGHPQSDDARDSFNQPGNETTDQRHLNLKVSIKQPLFCWNLSYLSLR